LPRGLEADSLANRLGQRLENAGVLVQDLTVLNEYGVNPCKALVDSSKALVDSSKALVDSSKTFVNPVVAFRNPVVCFRNLSNA
jgi:hypothetical protein